MYLTVTLTSPTHIFVMNVINIVHFHHGMSLLSGICSFLFLGLSVAICYSHDQLDNFDYQQRLSEVNNKFLVYMYIQAADRVKTHGTIC